MTTADITIASNIVSTDGNPAYAAADFLADYPHFTEHVPEAMITRYIAMANAAIAYDRWFDEWTYAMGLYTAHLCALYLRMIADAEATRDEAEQAGQNPGELVSMKQGDASVTFDHGAEVKAIETWGTFTTTAYGRQFASLARLKGLGGSYVI